MGRGKEDKGRDRDRDRDRGGDRDRDRTHLHSEISDFEVRKNSNATFGLEAADMKKNSSDSIFNY